MLIRQILHDAQFLPRRRVDIEVRGNGGRDRIESAIDAHAEEYFRTVDATRDFNGLAQPIALQQQQRERPPAAIGFHAPLEREVRLKQR